MALAIISPVRDDGENVGSFHGAARSLRGEPTTMQRPNG